MLTCPSDSLPQIVCPMDEDSIPPNPYCSAPSHSEPPPPLLPLSSVTPSCPSDGIPGQRRSGRIHGITAQTPKKQSSADSGSIQKPFRHNPLPTKRQREGESMGQVSRRKQLRVESTHEDGFDGRCPTEHQSNQMDQESPQKTTVSTENVVEQLAYSTTQNHTDIAKSDMDEELDTLESASAPKGWVIGPLFQSFRSKMASFTEIVMSPVKLFRPNSPPPFMDNPEKVEFEQPADGPSDVGHADPNSTFHPDGQSGTDTKEVEAAQQRLSYVENAQNTKTDFKYSKKLFFDEELSTNDLKKADTYSDTCEHINRHDSAPVQQNHIPSVPTATISESSDPAFGSSVLLQTSFNFITSDQSKLEISNVIKDRKDRQTAIIEPLPRKRMRNKSELKKVVLKPLMCQFKKEESGLEANNSSDNQKAVPLSFSGCPTQPETDSLQLTGNEKEIKMERRHLIRQSLRSNSSNGRTMKTATDVQQMEYSVAGLGRASRGLKPLYQSQDMFKRKEMMMMVENNTNPTKKGELVNEASDSGLLIEPPREEAMLTGTVVHKEVIRNPSIKKKTHSTRANKKVNEVTVTVNEGMLKKKTESSTEAKLVYSTDKSGDFSGKDQNLCSSKMKPSASCKRQNTRAGPVVSVVSTDESMDLETTVAISSTKVEGELLSEVFIHPEIKQHQSKCRNSTKKTQKRKSPVQASSIAEVDIALASTSSVLLVDSSEPMATDFNISQPPQREENLKTGFTRSSKRPKKGSSNVFKSSESSGAQERQQYMDDNNVETRMRQTQHGESKISRNTAFFEMTTFKNDDLPASLCSHSHSSCPVLLNNEAKPAMYEKEKNPAFPLDEVFSTVISVSMPRSSARKVNTRPKRADKQKRLCRVLHSRTYKGEEVPKSVTMDDAELATASAHQSGSNNSRGLLRSYSCPEIPSFRSHETPWTGSQHLPHHSRTPTSPQHQSSNTQHVQNPQKSVHRARRHTVCSVEVEREIAPLCLRKEVYPTRRSAPYDFVMQHLSPTLALSPSTTLSALASCFLSSPLAFLSKKGDSRCSAASPSTSMHVSPATSSPSKSLFSSSTWHLPGFLHSTDSSHATLDPSSSTNSLECEPQIGQQCEEEDDGEDTSSSSQEYEDVGLREEKALSDSEIKVVQKHEERGKVSSIRIRKTLPKPQNNLTPMGLPKPIRLKKKEFSLEEIYTNKNFSKPPESRLETIFEVPFNRRNGSESWFGQRRVKRFLEFLEVGEVRKPKKPLVGIGKTGLLASRTRRGGSTKDEPSLTAQDVDSLLCAKLDELNLWLISDQNS